MTGQPGGAADRQPWFERPLVRRRVLLGLGCLLAAVALIAVALRAPGSDGDGAEARRDVEVIAVGLGGSEPATGRAWQAVKGTWEIEDDRISVRKPGELLVSMLVTDAGSADAVIVVRCQVVATNAGVVFRYADPFNYWMVRAVRHVASWQVVKVVGGEGTVVGDTGFSPTADGTLVGVTTRADGVITVSFDGRQARTFLDPALADRRGAGVATIGGASSRAVFRGFTVTPAIGATAGP